MNTSLGEAIEKLQTAVARLKVQRLDLPRPGTLLKAPSFVVRRIDADKGREVNLILVLGYEFSNENDVPAFRVIFLSSEPRISDSVLFLETNVANFRRWFTQV